MQNLVKELRSCNSNGNINIVKESQSQGKPKTYFTIIAAQGEPKPSTKGFAFQGESLDEGLTVKLLGSHSNCQVLDKYFIVIA